MTNTNSLLLLSVSDMICWIPVVLGRIFDANSTDNFSWQVDEMYREAPIKNSMFDYVEFTRILKHGAKDLEDQWAAAAATIKLYFHSH